jgi:hypothetical protein
VSGSGKGTFSTPGARLRSQYAALQPEERFRAALEAAARDDSREHEALLASCPKKRYEMGDMAFYNRIDASRELAFPVAIYLAREIGQLKMLDAGREAIVRLLRMMAEVAAELDDEDPADAARALEQVSAVRVLQQLSAELRSQAAAVFEAFRRVCRDELGLEPETVLTAHLGPLAVATLLELDQLEGAKPDKRIMREWRVRLVDKWREFTSA